jgi:hypothetical protein
MSDGPTGWWYMYAIGYPVVSTFCFMPWETSILTFTAFCMEPWGWGWVDEPTNGQPEQACGQACVYFLGQSLCSHKNAPLCRGAGSGGFACCGRLVWCASW